MKLGSLFAGIGGFDLGFERAGFETVWQVEIDEYCRRVLERHFPRAERFGDIRECGKHNLKPVDVICGGFPCQDISFASATQTGISGERSGLWSHFARLLGEIRPSYAVIENVPALASGRGLGTVLADLAYHGFDAEWGVLPSCAFGAPHTRERLFIVAYTQEERRRRGRPVWPEESRVEIGGRDTELLRAWTIEPNISRVAYGIPRRLDRVRAIGNSVNPQIAQWIAERIKAQLRG